MPDKVQSHNHGGILNKKSCIGYIAVTYLLMKILLKLNKLPSIKIPGWNEGEHLK